MIELPLAWILTVIGTLSATVATLAGVMWGFMKSRLAAQDVVISQQSITIAKLQDDVDRLSRGCGIDNCHWKFSHKH
jgi:hypothetical protein